MLVTTLAAVVLVVVSACGGDGGQGSGSAGGGNGTADPCQLLTPADVLSVTKATVTSAKEGEVGCVFDDADNVTQVELQVDDGGTVENTGDKIPGLGDDSGYEEIVGFPDLSVVKGTWAFTIDSQGNLTKDEAIALAKIVLNRLP